MTYGRIVSFGIDRNLMTSRSLVIRSAGFTVDEAYSVADVLRLVRHNSVDAVVICHTVPLKEQEEIMAALRGLREPLPVIAIATSQYAVQPEEQCVKVENSPVPLIDAIRLMMTRADSDWPRGLH